MNDFNARRQQIRLLVLDVDGVLTDGSIFYSALGDELKRFHVRDGSGIKLWRSTGREIAILSGRRSAAVERRAAELGIEAVLLGVENKAKALHTLQERFAALASSQIATIADDVQDLSLFPLVNLKLAVADACSEVRHRADYITTTPGGQGAVREAIEWLLEPGQEWARLVETLAQRTPAG